MNSNAIEHAAASLAGDQRWQAVQRVLTSPTFAKAPRMSALLAFLMLRKLSGMEATITEHAIGIEVFRRDARDYDTAIDPVVRVQMGRLRERLAQYYAAPLPSDMLRIAIPPGSYVPVLGQDDEPAAPPATAELRLAPVRALAADGGADVFAAGLEEELALQLFQRFGRPRQAGRDSYQVEVSVRVAPGLVRASLRLVDGVSGQAVWLHRLDRPGDLGIGQQEALAMALCDELRAYLDASAPARRLPDHDDAIYSRSNGSVCFGEETLPS